MPHKTAFITGITGQDGSYLAELLLDKNYEVHGLYRRTSTTGTDRIDHILPKIQLHHGDLSDATNLPRLLEQIAPDEIYNLAAQSNVAVSFEQPTYTANVNALGPLRLLEAMRDAHIDPRFYQASTSEMFGNVDESPQNEQTPFNPESPYGCAKLYAYHATRSYRDAHGLFTANGIQFNHESPRRGTDFVTRKITRAVANIHAGTPDRLTLGNLDAERDWGYAPEYVEAMWQMLQLDEPDDFVIATGQTHTVREFATIAFREADIELAWEETGVEERGVNKETGNTLVDVSPELYRPVDVQQLVGDASKARDTFGWTPQTTFEDLVRKMVRADLEKVIK